MTLPKAKQTARVPGPRGATCHTTKGNPCAGYPMKGTDPPVCTRHLPNRQARRNALVRAEVFAWRVGTPLIDPPTALLRLTTQSQQRADLLAGLIDRGLPEDPDDLPNIVKQLVGVAYGETGPTGEFTRGLVRIESEERDRLGRFLKLCIDADLGERLVRVEEAEAVAMLAALQLAMGDVLAGLGVAVDQGQVKAALRTRLLELETGGPS